MVPVTEIKIEMRKERYSKFEIRQKDISIIARWNRKQKMYYTTAKHEVERN